MTKFRVTKRCLVDDLGQEPHHASREARYLSELHVALRTFYNKRCLAPGVGENMLNVSSYPNVKTLHVGGGRAVTIHDQVEDVCWLLAYDAKHRVGAKDDAYKLFERLDERGELLPTSDDYLSLESVSSAEFIDALIELGKELYEEALSSPGREVGRTIEFSTAGSEPNEVVVSVAIAIEMLVDKSGSAEECVVAFTVPAEESFGVEQALDVVSALIPPEVDVDEVDYATHVGDRQLDHAKNELAFSWARYSL